MQGYRLTAAAIAIFALHMTAAADDAALSRDTAAAAVSVAAAVTDTVPPAKKGLVDRIIAYFGNANKPKEDPHKFDISFIGGPYYSDEVSVALGLVASGTYRLGEEIDTLVPPSVVALKAKVSVTGFVEVGVEGTNIFPGNRWRLMYDFRFRHLPTYFWGIGFDMCHNDSEKSKYTEVSFIADVKMLSHLGHNFYLGPSLFFEMSNSHHVQYPWLWRGQPENVNSFGPGIEASFDTRDNLTAPERGVNIHLRQSFLPRFLGNGDYGFSFTELTACAYQRAWKGAVIAEQVHGRWAYGNVPWTQMSTMGGSSRMRGYYEGQYRDKFEADATVELRQHVWHRSGAVLWGGIAAIAPDPAGVRLSELLPCIGVGYRWEFKKHSNVRVDFGVGRGSHGFVFSINEAF